MFLTCRKIENVDYEELTIFLFLLLELKISVKIGRRKNFERMKETVHPHVCVFSKAVNQRHWGMTVWEKWGFAGRGHYLYRWFSEQVPAAES